MIFNFNNNSNETVGLFISTRTGGYQLPANTGSQEQLSICIENYTLRILCLHKIYQNVEEAERRHENGTR